MTTILSSFDSFDSWGDVLDHVRAGEPLYYQDEPGSRPRLLDACEVQDDEDLIVFTDPRSTARFVANEQHRHRFFLSGRMDGDGMTTKHDCNGGHGPVFGKRTPGCPRCDELAKGAPPVRWRKQRETNYQRFRRELAAHDCKRAGCMVVCTFGDP